MAGRAERPNYTFEVMNKQAMNMSWSLDSRLKLALAAAEFFNVENKDRMAQLLPKTRPHARGSQSPPFSALDFALYLERTNTFARKANHFRVQQIVSRMAAHGFLVHTGYAGKVPELFGEQYLHFHGLFGERLRGNLWLAPVLGPELLYQEARPGIVHVTGTKDGDTVGGTGIVIHPNYIVTCGHVVGGVDLDSCQNFQGKPCLVEKASVQCHPT